MIVDSENLKGSPVMPDQTPMTKVGTIDKRRKSHKNGLAFLNSEKGQAHLSKKVPNVAHVQEAYRRQRGAAFAKGALKKQT